MRRLRDSISLILHSKIIKPFYYKKTPIFLKKKNAITALKIALKCDFFY